MISTLSSILFIGGMGGQEILVILLIVLLLFGAKKIPELAKGFGKGIREFKDATKDVNKEIQGAGEEVKDIKKTV